MKEKKWGHLQAPGRLKKWRAQTAKLNQQEAATFFGIDLASYNAFECARERPGIDTAAKIEAATKGYVKATQWAQIDKACTVKST